MESNSSSDGVAIIGMAGRFPGAANVDQFWENLAGGVESISRFTVEQLENRDAAQVSREPNYVRARSVLENIDQFDAAFFGIYPQEARLIDPQHRVFLECCWEAFEDAGYDPGDEEAVTGVFAGCSPNSYFLTQVCRDRQFAEDYSSAYQVGFYPAMLGAISDTLSTRVSYKLNLKGPSLTLQSACSTSLVAVAQACQSLLSFQCDRALAGAVSITLPQRRGYLYQEGGMVSPDGHCRTFDADAQGTVFGSGAGVVLLKRAEDALADGDHIYAIIRGSAVNNDGAHKAGFTAPSAEGQAKVILMAQAVAGVDPRTIGYIEAHGTATPLGDPIEMDALTQAFRTGTDDVQFCAIGTAKTNVGHLDAAAGVTGLIKTALCLSHRRLTPSLHFQKPNPKLNLETSPFFVNTKLREWPCSNGVPRRAGVSAFGVGGTNAHAVLEEAPPTEGLASARPSHILTLSARSLPALTQAAVRLAEHLEKNSGVDLADVGFTLQTGRKAFPYRSAVVCRDGEDSIRRLREIPGRIRPDQTAALDERSVYFLFPGQGAQYVHMAKGVYDAEPLFRQEVARCCDLLRPHLGLDLRTVLYPEPENAEEATRQLNETALAQPALFTIEYALARLWMSWGILPKAMVGHSVGEFVAACLADVFSLPDALMLIAARGRMMQALQPGGMLSVRLPEQELLPRMGRDLAVAAINAPSLTVVAGPHDALARLEAELSQANVTCRRLYTSHAFHSPMMEPIVEPFTELVRRVRLSAPKLPYVSCVSGDWITAAEATEPVYWARHFRQPVLFSDAILRLRAERASALLEVGPGITLQTLARQHPGAGSNEQIILSSLPKPTDEAHSLYEALANLWTAGAKPNWRAFSEHETRRRTPLPSYPFERERFWVDVPEAPPQATLPSPPNSDSTPINTEQSLMSAPAPARASAERFLPILAALFEDLSGMPASALDPSTSFLELGFDSLFLTQISQAVQSRFGVSIAFRLLLNEVSSLGALAHYLDHSLPATAFAEPAPPPSIAQADVPVQAASAAGSDGAIERLMKEQLQAMSQLMAMQLEALRGAPPAVPAKPPAPVNAPQPAPAKADAEFKPFGPYKPVERGPSGDLTVRQKEHLENLIARYTKRTQGSKQLTQQYRKVLADPRVAAGFKAQWKEMVYPIVTNRSRGSRLWDVDGNEYIDLLNGFGPISFGHMPDFLRTALEEQLRAGIEIGPQTPLAGRVAELLCELTGMERATFCNTGSEAVMAALRVARTVTGRKKVALFGGSYHGMFDEVLVKRLGPAGSLRTGPIAPGIPAESLANIIVLDYATPESLDIIKSMAGELAAVLVEPVQSRHPALQPAEFLQQVREITAASGTALIFDEVVTGFRSHPGGAQALFNIRADMATYGKVLGGGVPIGALAGSCKFMDALDGGMWQYGDDSFPEVGVTFFAGTFVRHPLAMAAAHAVLKHIKEQGPELQLRLTQRTTALVARLNELLEQNSLPTRIESFGSVFYFLMPSSMRFGSLLYYHLREKGIHIQEGFPCFLTTEHSDQDIDRIVAAFSDSIAELQHGELFPARVVQAAAMEAPVTEAQLEIWLASQFSPEASCAFNETSVTSFDGALNITALTQSLQIVVGRHQALRATFSAEGTISRFAPRLKLDVPVINWANLPPDERDRKFDSLLRLEASLPFDLESGPLIRVQLVRLREDRHKLVFTGHHIVVDGWSTNVILEELATCYAACVRGLMPELPAAVPFAEYAIAQGRQSGGAEASANETYWTEQFKSVPAALDLPSDRPRPPVKGYAGGTYRTAIAHELMKAVQRAGARKGSTLFVTLLSAFEALLMRLTNQDDIVVGIPTAGQSILDRHPLVGHCVNFLPLRAHITEGQSFSDLLSHTKATVLSAYEHQNYTYGTLVRKLGIVRDPSRMPLVEVQFNLEKVGARMEFPGLDVHVDSGPKQYANFDLFLNIVESANGLSLDCDYNAEIFHEETIGRWLKHYETLLASIVDGMDLPVTELALLSDSEQRQMIAAFSPVQTEYPREKCAHHLFEEQATQNPLAIAAEFENQSYSYGDLNQRASQVANALRKQGVRPEQLVAVYMERSLDMLVALLGVLKAGGAYVPLDPAYPKERIDQILGDAQVRVVLTQERLALNLAEMNARIICLDAEWGRISRESGQPAPEPVRPHNLAYIIYTSGSTGVPKGVEVSHGALVNFLWSMRETPGIEAADRLLAVTTLSFDIAGLELFLPLTTGARVVIASRETASDGHQLAKQIEASGITILQATPSTWRLLLEAGWKPDASLKMLCGGEALPRDLADELLAGGKVWNMYGPTETTIWSAAGLVNPGPDSVRIGRPIANTRFYVLDRHQRPVPLGVPGELNIGGDGVARGYYRRPQLTNEMFVADPFRKQPGDRMYKTGDLVRALPDGTLEFLGRIDHQVKIRGFRIELGEIEAVLMQHREVGEAVVIAREERGVKRLAAYVTPKQDVTPDATELKAWLAQKLPAYMTPAFFINLPALPRTPNGKIYRRALPAPDPILSQPEQVHRPPRNEQEEKFASICSEVLRFDRVGISDNLLELGADSIQIFQIVARASRAGVAVTAQELLRYPTIERLFAAKSTAAPAPARPGPTLIRPVARDRYRVEPSTAH